MVEIGEPIPLWDERTRPRPAKRGRKWRPRCEVCKRPVWSAEALTLRYGKRLGDTCYRRRRAAEQRIVIRIAFTPPGHIPGQIALPPFEKLLERQST